MGSFPETPPSPPRRPRSSPPMPTTNPESRSRFTKVREVWSRITTCSVSSCSTESHQLPEVSPRLRSPSTLMLTVSSTLPLVTRPPANPVPSPSPTTRADFPRRRSRSSSLRPRDTRLRMSKLRNRIEMKTGLESYCYQMRQQLDDEKMRAHFSEKDKSLINGLTNECLIWLSSRSAEEAAPNQL